ncbi:hypothetical protein [Microbacterium sp. SD291]|uniref:hypothetical protein n=1 Tax=Microbacterium sp. SD291 TaxID=2782007 RepID=UPI001A961C61|nr:hypothetical protein [Microbacterium sp. SD291]MBO0982200.1 hypothetical protein [Microbacterium sp. SD291]
MTPDSPGERVTTAARGRTTVSARALQRLAAGLARDAARVSRRDVGVALADDRGGLRVSVTVPVALAAVGGGTILDRGEDLRHAVIDGMRELADRAVSTVDVRYSGVRRLAERRVS